MSDEKTQGADAAVDFCDLALDHAAAGYPVFPARQFDESEQRQAKSPYVEEWEQRATTDPEQILKWWSRWPDAVPAIPPGRVGATVIDLDTHQDRPSGLDTAALNGYQDHTAVEGTSFSGLGRHLWFRGTDYSVNGVYDGIDRKSNGGYVVVVYPLPKPEKIIDPLPDYYKGYARVSTGEASEQDAQSWVLERAGKMGALVQATVDQIPDPFTGHQNLIDVVRTLVGYGARGYQGAGTGLIEASRLWMSAEHASGDPGEEFNNALVGAIRKFGTETVPEYQKLLGEDDDAPFPGAFTSEDLLDMEFPPVEWVVPGVIPEGLTVLIANPKIGKSWMVLGIANALAHADEVWGKSTKVEKKHPVLYLALEDSKRSLQSRLKMIGAKPSRELAFIPRIDQDKILGTMKEFLELNQAKRPLVILDTLGRAMPADVNEGGYREEYRFVAQIKDMIPPGASIILVHHTNKAEHDDFMLKVSGTQGIAGAADTVVYLKRDRNETNATVLVTSREAPEQELELLLTDGKWSDGTSTPINVSGLRGAFGLGSPAPSGE